MVDEVLYKRPLWWVAKLNEPPRVDAMEAFCKRHPEWAAGLKEIAGSILENNSKLECCHKTRVVGWPCPIGRKCPHD